MKEDTIEDRLTDLVKSCQPETAEQASGCKDEKGGPRLTAAGHKEEGQMPDSPD